ncbi:MAG: hypothetical protein ACOWW1_09425 [archaeon]|nr:S1C family serine protease [Candidatus Bathyarchaeum sp.]
MSLGGNVITGINGVKVINMNDLAMYREQNTQPEDSGTFTIIRDGQEISLTATLAE